MDISVIICTRNRALQLGEVLTSLADMAPVAAAWELIIVDNGSTDATPAVIDSFAGRLPVRHVYEATPGLSNARNRGVAETLGGWIVWTDDDVLVGPGWLKAYAQAIADNPDALVLGGKVTPVLLGPVPSWWEGASGELEGLVARRDFGPEPVALSIEENRLPFGANYAVRASEQKALCYDPLLGVGPNRKRLGEETQVIRALLRSGRGMSVPDAEVLHQIPQGRLTEKYAEVYFRSIGETWAYLDDVKAENFMGPEIKPDTPRWRGAPRWVWRAAFVHRLAFLWTRAFAPSSIWINDLRMWAMCAGALAYWTRADAD